MSKREFCPLDEIDWSALYHQGRPGGNEPDPEGEIKGIDLMVKRHTEVYPPDERRTYMERRLRAWWQARER